MTRAWPSGRSRGSSGRADRRQSRHHVSVNAEGFGRLSKKINTLLADEAGNDETIRVGATTRLLVVDSGKHKSRGQPHRLLGDDRRLRQQPDAVRDGAALQPAPLRR